jgi:restriction endonuclease S subunit
LEGLEISEIWLSEVLKASYSQRIDSYFFQKEFLKEPFENNFYQLNTICTIKSGTTPSIRDENLKQGIILLKTDNIRNGVLNFMSENDFFFINKETNQTMKATELQNDDVLINIVGATTDVIGRCSVLSKDFPKANITQAMALLRIEGSFKAKFNSHFLFAFLSSKLGHKQIRRIARPTGQFNMNLEEVGSIKIPVVSIKFQIKIQEILLKSENLKSQSQTLYTSAENLLLSALGLGEKTLQGFENLVRSDTRVNYNIKSFKDSFLTSGRLDAEYYQPKYEELEKKIREYEGGFCKIGDYFTQNKSTFIRNKKGFNYIEIGDISVSDGSVGFNFIETENLPDNAKIKANKGDLLVSKVRPNRGAVAIIDFEQEDLVCSGAFTVLQENKNSPIKKETLQVFLRLENIKDLLLKYNCGTSYPVIKDEDILALEIPLFSQDLQTQISLQVQESFRLRAESERLLALAKEAVEVAIEKGEEEAISKLAECRPVIF